MDVGGPLTFKKSTKAQDVMLTALVANDAGEIFELNGYAALGMAGTAAS